MHLHVNENAKVMVKFTYSVVLMCESRSPAFVCSQCCVKIYLTQLPGLSSLLNKALKPEGVVSRSNNSFISEPPVKAHFFSVNCRKSHKMQRKEKIVFALGNELVIDNTSSHVTNLFINLTLYFSQSSPLLQWHFFVCMIGVCKTK